MLFIIEAIDLAGVFDSDFQGIQNLNLNLKFKSTLPRPAGFANFRWAGQDLLFCGAGRTSLVKAYLGNAQMQST